MNPPRYLRRALTHRTLRMRNEVVVKQLAPSSATGNRALPSNNDSQSAERQVAAKCSQQHAVFKNFKGR